MEEYVRLVGGADTTMCSSTVADPAGPVPKMTTEELPYAVTAPETSPVAAFSIRLAGSVPESSE